MLTWAALFLCLSGATSTPTTLEQIVGDYEGIRPSIDTPEPRRLSVRSDSTFHAELRLSKIAFDGEVRIEAGRVTLEGTVSLEGGRPMPDDPAEAGSRKFTEQFTLVHWGRRLYLIEDSQADSFVRDVIRGYEPRLSSDGIHQLRVGDWKLPAPGRPQVPEDWQKKFPPDNFRTRIARQLAYHRAEIHAGSRSGLAAGMLLTLFSFKYGATDLRVVSVTAGAAVIENDYGDPPLTKGTPVYSRVPETVATRDP